jgi:hypothetical protein
MARVEGIDPQTSFLARHVFKKVRKILGRDLTPQKIAARRLSLVPSQDRA